jgi:hypothetical protein
MTAAEPHPVAAARAAAAAQAVRAQAAGCSTVVDRCQIRLRHNL